MREPVDESMELTPTVMTLEALLSDGLKSLPPGVRRALDGGQYSEALSAANDAYSSQGPADREATLTYAVLLIGRQLVDEAKGVLRRALEHHAQDVGLQLAQTEALLMEGDFEAAQSLLEGLESVSTLEPRHYAFVGDMYLDIDERDRALECYRQALERGHESAEIAYRLAHLFDERGDADGAAHYLRMAAELAGDNPMLWQAAAEACYEVERVEDAADAWRRMLKERPTDIDAWFMLGLSYWFLDRFREAADAFERVVDLTPRHLVAWRQLGDVWLTIGRGEQALAAFEEALEINGDDVDALNGAVLAAYETGDVEAAAEWAKRAVELDPTNRESRYHYAVVLLSLGRDRRAKNVLQQLVDTGEGALGDYLGALAVAELKCDDKEAAFEHIGEAVRLDGGAEWLAAFAEELLKLRGADEAMDYLDRSVGGGDHWRVVRPFLGYVCAGLVEDDERAEAYETAFRDALEETPDVVPVFWNFESWEAMAFRLERRFEQTFDAMLGVIEGRREFDEWQ